MLTHESARGRRFQGLNVRHSECAAEVLITQMPRSADASCRDAATAGFFFGLCTECIVWTLRMRSPVSLSIIPMLHYSSTFQEAQIGLYRFPEKCLMVHEKPVRYVGPTE